MSGRGIGIALSGGGHRASVWGTGVLAAVVDVGLGGDVVSVSSVSGGSITNGVVAQNVDLHTATPADFDRAVRASLVSYARTGLFPHGPLTRGFLRAVSTVAVLAVVAPIVFIGAAVAVTASWIEGTPAGVLVGTIGVLALAIWFALAVLIARRGLVVRSAIARTHFGGHGRSLGTRLDQVDRAVNHVFLTTDLEAGDQFYLAPRFLYGFREGIADPAAQGVTVAAAVQASAGLPVAFPPIVLDVGSFRRPWNVPGDVPASPPQRVVLSDGGVYDNMAEQWESGIVERIGRWPELGEIQSPAEVLIVANSSAGWGWNAFGSLAWPRRELTALMRNQGVQYDVSTSRRRRAIVQAWTVSEQRGSGQHGVIVMVDRDPYVIADGFAHGGGDRAVRARLALEFLGDDTAHRAEWAERARLNASVPTVLDALGLGATLDLLEHAYTSTIVGLYVIEGLGELRRFDRKRFELLMA